MNLWSAQDKNAAKLHESEQALVLSKHDENRQAKPETGTPEKPRGIFAESIGSAYCFPNKGTSISSPAYMGRHSSCIKPYNFKHFNIRSPTDTPSLFRPDIFKHYRCPQKQKSVSINKTNKIGMKQISCAPKRLNFMDQSFDSDSESKGLFLQVKEPLPSLMQEFKELTFDDRQPLWKCEYKSKTIRAAGEMNLSSKQPSLLQSNLYLSKEINKHGDTLSPIQQVQSQDPANKHTSSEKKQLSRSTQPAIVRKFTTKRSSSEEIKGLFDRSRPTQLVECQVFPNRHSTSSEEIKGFFDRSHPTQLVECQFPNRHSTSSEEIKGFFDRSHPTQLVECQFPNRHSTSSEEIKGFFDRSHPTQLVECQVFPNRHSTSSEETKEQHSDESHPVPLSKRCISIQRRSSNEIEEQHSDGFQVRQTKRPDSDKENSLTNKNFLGELHQMRNHKRRNSCPCSEEVGQSGTPHLKRQKLNDLDFDESKCRHAKISRKRRRSLSSQ